MRFMVIVKASKSSEARLADVNGLRTGSKRWSRC